MKELVRNQAINKMLDEMKESKSLITERLHIWLCNTDDEELVKSILKTDRNINQATEYLYAKGSAIAMKGVADVTPEMEQKWCREYYLKDKIDTLDLKVLPPAKGEKIEVIKEVVREVEKVIYKEPSIEEIGLYLEQEKAKKQVKKHDNVEFVGLDL